MDTLYAGATRVDITPELGHNLAGWIDIRPATRQVTPILAHVLALMFDKTRIIIITCDLVGMGEDLRKRIEEIVQKDCNVPPQQLFILPTHNHYGPSVSGSYASNAERTGQENAYTEALITKFAAAARTAMDNLKPAQMTISYTQEATHIQNDRFWRKDGTINWVGKREKEFVKDSGPIDPQVATLRIADAQDNTIATLYNYACHANAAEEDGFSAISWDWPGYATQVIETALGGEAFFLVGACGNIHPLREGNASEMGQKIGNVIVEAVKNSSPLPAAFLKTGAQEMVLPPRDFTGFDPHQIELICSQLWDAETQGKVQAIFMKILDDLKTKGLPDQVRQLRVFAIGDLAFVFIPGELFVELGMEIKRRSPFTHTFVVESLSESLGYIPTRIAYEEGGYQPAVGTRLAPGGGELIVEKSIGMLADLKP
jgi:hypothetical protein